MDVLVYKKAVEEICKENRRSISFGTFACSPNCIFKKNKLCSGHAGTADSIVNVANKINNKSVEIVSNWLNDKQS